MDKFGRMIRILQQAREEADKLDKPFYVCEDGEFGWHASPIARAGEVLIVIWPRGGVSTECETCATNAAARQRAADEVKE